jgi:hypothetical protein
MTIRRIVSTLVFNGLVAMASQGAAAVVDFEGLLSVPQTYFNGDPGNLSPGGFDDQPWTSGGAWFSNTFGIDNTYDPFIFEYWNGFAYSNVVDTTTPGPANEYAAYPGGGYQSGSYAVAFGNGATISFPSPSIVSGFRIANTTYAFRNMVYGDEIHNFNEGLEADGWFMVTATGSLSGSPVGAASIYLADLTNFGEPLAEWAWFDLADLGAVDTIAFSFSGSDVLGPWLNTPAYFAIDDLTYAPVPEPGTWALGAGAIVAAWGLQRRWARKS